MDDTHSTDGQPDSVCVCVCVCVCVAGPDPPPPVQNRECIRDSQSEVVMARDSAHFLRACCTRARANY